ncbi:PQQ-dependent sugar dehydrogenase [Peribacillus sp. NPDC096540]|uniref:PQQ-dependent sugar dehydrogenase n=1 Tax=Peribacillus sp. NPDC096540 TaxID=3390612 RepID=UPI003D01B9A3
MTPKVTAWGLRNPFRLKFDHENRLFATIHGIDERGSRPIANSPDEFHIISPGTWYGWPDYTGGLLDTLPMFKPDNKPQPEYLLRSHPMQPPKPLASFEPHSATLASSRLRETLHYQPVLFGV